MVGVTVAGVLGGILLIRITLDATMKPMPRVVTAGMKNIQKVIHPSSRWRGDFDKVVASMPEYSFVARMA